MVLVLQKYPGHICRPVGVYQQFAVVAANNQNAAILGDAHAQSFLLGAKTMRGGWLERGIKVEGLREHVGRTQLCK
jgi:hypothetical protein